MMIGIYICIYAYVSVRCVCINSGCKLTLVSRLSDNRSSSVCVFFTTNIGLIFKGVVSSRIYWFALNLRHAPFTLFKTFMNKQFLKLFYIFSESLETKARCKHCAVKSLFNALLGDILANHVTRFLKKIRIDPDFIHLFQIN